MAQRLRRPEQVERNREVVLAAARRIFISEGYAGATVEAIASDAGFSTGVVYSQFGSKADLFLALLERRIDERAAQNERIALEASGTEGLQELLRVAADETAADHGWGRLLLEFRLVAARDPGLNARYAALHHRTIERLSSALRRLYGETAPPPTVPFAVMAEFILAVGSGVVLERAADPGALGSEHVTQMVPRALGMPEPDRPVKPSGDPRSRNRRGR